MPITFTIQGMERTCTNYTRHLITHNFDDVQFDYGPHWKHGPVHEPADRIDAYVIGAKHPFPWLESYFEGIEDGHIRGEHYRDHGTILDQFSHDIERGMMHCRDQRDMIKALITKYNKMYKNWTQSIPHEDWIVVRHRDLLTDFHGMMDTIRSFLGDPDCTHGQYMDEDREVETDADVTDSRFETDYYLDHHYRDYLSVSHKCMLVYFVDWDFFREAPFAYDVDFKAVDKVSPASEAKRRGQR
jgi:hypothetical protein